MPSGSELKTQAHHIESDQDENGLNLCTWDEIDKKSDKSEYSSEPDCNSSGQRIGCPGAIRL